ncbi:MAG: homoserine O-acetyltransferase MetX [Gammaproteobacteria bacterium]
MTALGSGSANPGHFQCDTPLTLESGEILEYPTIAYRSWGTLSAERDNAILICHALTGSDDVDHWWPGLIGAGRALDPARDYILCTNVLGSCYGTIGPASINPRTGRRYGSRFPAITVGDMVELEHHLVDAMGIKRLTLVIGGSLGGMQALEWGVRARHRIGALMAIATTDRQSAWAIAFSEAQRMAILADPRWQGGDFPPSDPPLEGLRAARTIAMLSYRHWGELSERFGRRQRQGNFEIINWLAHHGKSLAHRFDAGSYITLTRAMDTHDLERSRIRVPALQNLADFPPTLVIGITSDLLYPPEEQIRLASKIPGAELAWLDSPHGHDAFLIEIDQLDVLLRTYRAKFGDRQLSSATTGNATCHP